MAKLLIAIALVASTIGGPVGAQVLVETGVLSSPKKPKDLGDIWDKAMKEPNGSKPAAKPATKAGAGAATTAPVKPKVLPETFSGETEPAENILDINPDALTRFASALTAETVKRSQDPSLTRLQYDETGAKAGQFTPRQYFVLKARVRPFCEAITARQAPSDNLTLSYMPSEGMAMRPRCATLLPLLKLTPAIPLGK